MVPYFTIDDSAFRTEVARALRGEGPVGDETVLTDAHCEDPLCPCRESVLFPVRIDGLAEVEEPMRSAQALDRARHAWEHPDKSGWLHIHVESWKVRPVEEAGRDDPRSLSAARIRKRLTLGDIETYAAHREATKEWAKTNWFRGQDWRYLEPGVTVAYTEVFPGTLHYAVEYLGRRYFFSEQYCVTPACPCRDILFCVYEVDRGDRSLCTGRVNVEREQPRLVEHMRGDRRLFLALLESLWATHPGIAKEFRRRVTVMKEFGRFLEESRKTLKDPPPKRPEGEWTVKIVGFVEPPRPAPAPPAPTRVTGWATRNGPCPCGSGRKYKLCCGRNA